MTCDITFWTQNDVKSQKMEYSRRHFLYRTETLYSCYTNLITKFHDNVHCDISMATQWASGPPIQKAKS